MAAVKQKVMIKVATLRSLHSIKGDNLLEYLSANMFAGFISQFLGEAAKSEFFHTIVIFACAALLHARQVKKEIREQFALVTTAINEVASALRQDMRIQSERVGLMERFMDKLDERVTKLEGD